MHPGNSTSGQNKHFAPVGALSQESWELINSNCAFGDLAKALAHLCRISPRCVGSLPKTAKHFFAFCLEGLFLQHQLLFYPDGRLLFPWLGLCLFRSRLQLSQMIRDWEVTRGVPL